MNLPLSPSHHQTTMKTRTVRIIRKIVLSCHVNAEVPADATNEALISALHDQAECYDHMEICCGVHEMDREEDSFEVEDAPSAVVDRYFKIDGGDWDQAIEADNVLLG